MALGTLGLALTLGLAANLYCAGACLPVLSPYVMGRTDGTRGGLWLGLWFILGRLPLYLGIGLAVGAAGGAVLEGRGLAVTVAMRIVLASIIISYGAVLAFTERGRRWCAHRPGGNALAVVMGVLVGSIACPPLLVLLGEVFIGGSALLAVGATLVFWASSSIAILLASGLSGWFAEVMNSRWEEGKLREVTGWVLIMVGVFYLATLAYLLL